LLQNAKMVVENVNRDYTVTFSFDQPAPLQANGDWQAFVVEARDTFPGTGGETGTIEVFSET